ncbi:hypothetical protein QJS10_CPB18g01459 [Acorus calamus]|uniref:Uncharacterized protein n=1 Tax=Acorus calamus TaxID=4465 RepID=A0AAV9CNW6_ACOCL|nr:hypothetical protein QJS10_CPB18g01459 [Acorus calamus]
MVSLFSRFTSAGRSGHRRSRSAIEVSQTAIPNANAPNLVAAAVDSSHGIEVTAEFKPVEHPSEPLNCDEPVKCPLPEPSILNDGRIWKERLSVNARTARVDLPVVNDETRVQSKSSGKKPRPSHVNHSMGPSLSAPEYKFINLLEECNTTGV